MNVRQIGILSIILSLSLLVRLYQLDRVPFGLNIDEASMGYNAYSLLQTGKDRYGQAFPLIFRSFGSFQAPLYTYFTVPAVLLFGTSFFAVHLVSALSGFIIVCATFLIAYVGLKQNFKLAIFATVVVGFTPWSVLFTRFGTEASLGLALFVSSVAFFILSLNKIYLFIPASFFLGLATHAYYSERVISIIFFIGFVFLFPKKLLRSKLWLILGIIIFISTLLPHLSLLGSGAFTRRLEQVNYFSKETFLQQGENLRYLPLGRVIYIAREFSSQYTAYFSPRNLFFDPDPQGARSIPDLSVFYSWMVIPFFIGIYHLFKNRSLPLNKILIFIILISPIPAALTRDPFYTLRTLVFLWSISFAIAFGIYNILIKIPFLYLKFGLALAVVLFSTVSFYISYFVLFKYERAKDYGYSYVSLIDHLKKYPGYRIIIDSTREYGVGLRIAYLTRYNPRDIQNQLQSQLKTPYYSSDVNVHENYKIGNIETRFFEWKEANHKNTILVGDILSVSDIQAKEHHLIHAFDVEDLTGNITLRAYFTNPVE